jgi:hypothetical protein
MSPLCPGPQLVELMLRISTRVAETVAAGRFAARRLAQGSEHKDGADAGLPFALGGGWPSLA